MYIFKTENNFPAAYTFDLITMVGLDVKGKN